MLCLTNARSSHLPCRTHVRGIAGWNISRESRRRWPWISTLGAGVVVAALSGAKSFVSPLHTTEPGVRKDNVSTSTSSKAVPKSRESDSDTGSRKPPWPFYGWDSLPSLPSISAPDIDIGSWAWPESFVVFQGRISDLLLELSAGKGSLADEVLTSKPDPRVNPECSWDAEVRLGDDLSVAERAFLRVRKRKMRYAFAKLFNVPLEEIDERDIPIVAVAGSGGGLRAMCNTTGSLAALQEIHLLDCITYSAGISGSCWALGVLYSGVAGLPDPNRAMEHIKSRIQVPYVDISALDLLTKSPTNKYLLAGFIQKVSAPMNSISLTDVYGTLIASRLLIPDDLSKLDPMHLSLHHFRRFVDDGRLPMPIFTAISRYLPAPLGRTEKAVREQHSITVDKEQSERLKAAQRRIEGDARWMWFEFTPYEIGCDELGAWIPSWSLGREFKNGKSLSNTPEISFSILSGIFASAFSASLQHYFREIQPVLRQLPSVLYVWIAEIISQNEDDFEALHPIMPNALPNYVKGMDGQLRSDSPSGVTDPDTLGFMDAGAELNIPYYPLLRRNVDCIIALDASADSQDLWFTRAEEMATKRGLATWPRGARWPIEVSLSESPELPERESTEPGNRKLAASQEHEVSGQQRKQQETDERGLPDTEYPGSKKSTARTSPFSKSTSSAHLWIGSSSRFEHAFSSSNADELNEETLASHDGIGVIYMPLIANEKVENFDPLGVSTWRFELPPAESQKLFDLARVNVLAGEDMIVKVLRAMWLRKKRAREAAGDPGW